MGMEMGMGRVMRRVMVGRCEHLETQTTVWEKYIWILFADGDGKHLPLHKSAVCAGVYVSITSIL